MGVYRDKCEVLDLRAKHRRSVCLDHAHREDFLTSCRSQSAQVSCKSDENRRGDRGHTAVPSDSGTAPCSMFPRVLASLTKPLMCGRGVPGILLNPFYRWDSEKPHNSVSQRAGFGNWMFYSKSYVLLTLSGPWRGCAGWLRELPQGPVSHQGGP